MTEAETRIKPNSLPQVAIRLIRLATNPDVDFERIASNIKADPAIAARILQMANSAGYGAQSPVARLDHAIVRLGLRRTLSIAIAFTLAPRQHDKGIARARHELWLRCVTQAMTAEWFALHKQLGLVETPFVCGLLLDIGRLLLYDESPSHYEEVLSYQLSHDCSSIIAEQELLNQDHASMGAKFLQEIEIPSVIVQAVRSHEWDPDAQGEMSDFEACVSFASLIGELMFSSDIPSVQTRLMNWSETSEIFSSTDVIEAIVFVSEKLRTDGDLYFADATLLPNNEQLMAAAAVAAKVLRPSES